MYRRIYLAFFLFPIVALSVYSYWFPKNALAGGTDDPPVAVGDSYSGVAARFQGTPGVLANDYDPDGSGGIFAFVVTSPPVGQLILYPDGHFTYNPGQTGLNARSTI